MPDSPNTYRSGPDERGHFGLFGGRYVAETLMPLILDLEKAYTSARADSSFQTEMDFHLAAYVGRKPTRCMMRAALSGMTERRMSLSDAQSAGPRMWIRTAMPNTTAPIATCSNAGSGNNTFSP